MLCNACIYSLLRDLYSNLDICFSDLEVGVLTVQETERSIRQDCLNELRVYRNIHRRTNRRRLLMPSTRRLQFPLQLIETTVDYETPRRRGSDQPIMRGRATPNLDCPICMDTLLEIEFQDVCMSCNTLFHV